MSLLHNETPPYFTHLGAFWVFFLAFFLLTVYSTHCGMYCICLGVEIKNFYSLYVKKVGVGGVSSGINSVISGGSNNRMAWKY